ncbi:MAG: transcriptional regulator, partial [Panacagrimonas sp.]
MAASVEMPVDSSVDGALRVQMLGSFAIHRDDGPLVLPASRKLRALFAYLALAPRPVGRNALCELLWDGPNDPRGELRGCLSKIRSAIDVAGGRRVLTPDDTVQLDLRGDRVDAIEIERAIARGIEPLTAERKRDLVALFAGDFLEGLELADSPAFGAWLTAQRRRFRGCQTALLEQLVQGTDDDHVLGYLEKWLQLAPFDRRAHEKMLQNLARRGQLREAEDHLAAASALFESEGLDSAPLRVAWRAANAPVVVSAISRPQPINATQPELSASSPRRASIAVMPFSDRDAEPRAPGGVADALAYDVTVRLAKLRSMFVIAQGSVFALHERRIGPEDAGRMLNVDYVVGGLARV